MSERTANTKSPARYGAALGLLAAALFGISAPLAKLLLGALRPQLFAGLLYLGAGLGLSLFRALHPRNAESPLRRTDVLPLLAVVAFGGIAGPLLMLLGLLRVGALTGSLLLNIVLCGERIGVADFGAMMAMALGIGLLLRERHAHQHAHKKVQHEHIHSNDAHHLHEHEPHDPPTEPHSHAHRHAPLTHDHPHMPDLHHRHRHEER